MSINSWVSLFTFIYSSGGVFGKAGCALSGGGKFVIRAVGPADSAELHELRRLNKKGLTKFMMVDVSCHFVAH